MLKTSENAVVERVPLDTRVPPNVRIINGALDEDPNSPGSIVLQGRIDPNTLRFIKFDEDYQRPLANRQDIYDALKSGLIVPSVELGVRGESFKCEGNDYVVRPEDGDVYGIDGRQRIGTALALLDQIPSFPIRILATVHFGTDREWERNRFTELNKNTRKVSANLTLKNMRHENKAILTLYGLSENTKEFPLYRRVSWGQNVERGQLTTGMVMARAALRLHAHFVGGGGNSSSAAAQNLNALETKLPLEVFRKNVWTFFRVLDECWGVRRVEYRTAATHLKTSFMSQLARMFSAHLDFWDESDRVFSVPYALKGKLAKFPLNDPHVQNLAGAGGASANILYEMLIRHMNSGKRTGHLRSRYSRAA